MLLVLERDIGFLELVLLGMEVSKQALLDWKKNWEGVLVKIASSDLESRLTGMESWVPSGRAHILAWLALGAPMCEHRFARFKGRSGPELFLSIVG